ncbi:winged helix-turn-helix domain-containing protein [Mycolicibacterium monacense]|uniref:winged helix-turn-helix domain-containing protein n=1 Tax=Mycolicibacterium monacense TaxID=85693 RepID=UPI001F163DFF|nr:winged helix-turn-helix domain-containing protein [Mycolicibacterium monacense]
MSSTEETLQVPPWQKFARPVLEVLSDGAVWQRSALHTAVMDRLGLTAEQRAVTLNSGQGQAANRVGWAVSYLARAEAVKRVAKGQTQITEFGRQMLQMHPEEITQADLEAVPAFQAYVPKQHATQKVSIDTEHLPSYWFVGAFFTDEDHHEGPVGDQTDRFVAEGLWENGNKGKYQDQVKAMKPGDHIAIKAAFTRKHDLPFASKGHPVSVMAIKATGTITENAGDGYKGDRRMGSTGTRAGVVFLHESADRLARQADRLEDQEPHRFRLQRRRTRLRRVPQYRPLGGALR